MFTVVVYKQNPEAIYVTTPDYFSRLLQILGVTEDEVVWRNVSMESLALLLDRKNSYVTLK